MATGEPAFRVVCGRRGGQVHSWFLAATLAVGALLAMAPGLARSAVGQEATPGTGPREVILATTTSTQDSGLLDVLVPLFHERTGYDLKPIAVGSGAALELGERGEADVVLAHSPAAEEAFVAAGFAGERRTVMANDFVLVGPKADPAGTSGAASAAEAMAAIAGAEVPFVSRGDESGTHALELRLWEESGIAPGGSWYTESGTGMGDTLNIADDRDAYTLADRGTFLSLRDRLDLEILVEGDRALLNLYHVLTVNPANGPAVNVEGGRAFLGFLLDPATQEIIGGFGLDRFGEALFTPCADDACVVPAVTPAPPPATPAA
ncbi:MAG: Tungstate ABC transporter, substrate-binding protein [uncultured Thermomicrobiales bacterium]|uniref:Tungstate ABC transporter, substrate-binding protein n=1 Tax=uncultured Thermomicrobiales bacterium TaxID=1645740 RepID=A0A6J4VM36_9BACT|nr:MAG: Tungstate ABC transporter, substrate-binding protein [uncultured Thermomicrobiales bacterium]